MALTLALVPPPPSGSSPALPTIDRYQLVSLIGKGGMARVFHGRLQRIGGFERDVAVKLLLPEYSAEPEFVEMLLDEARIASAIAHPCVVQMLDVGREGDQFYLVMEYVNGTDLRSVLRRTEGRVPTQMALHVVAEVLRGLHAVHTAVDGAGTPRRIVHRDVSPANVLIDRTGAVKLGDFGIARASGRLAKTRLGSIKGKLRYMAPEQLQPRKSVDYRADLYAVGVMLAELLLGGLEGEPRRITPFGPVFQWTRRRAQGRIADDLAQVLDRAMAEEPHQRYADASVFRRDVVAALARRAPGYQAEELAAELIALGMWRTQKGIEPTETMTAPAADTGGSEPSSFNELDQMPTTIGAGLLRRSATEEQLVLAAMSPEGPGAALGHAAANSDAHALTGDGAVSPGTTLRGRRSTVGSYQLRPGLVTALGLRRGAGAARRLGRAVLRSLRTSRAAQVAAAVAGTALALVLAFALGGGAPPASTARPVPRAAAIPLVTTLPPPRATTGTVIVDAPTGATVRIGAVNFPPAPCRLELSPGSYTIKLRARGRRAVRHISVGAGSQVTVHF